jgi:hypothetical protein
MNLNYFIFRQLPVLKPDIYDAAPTWERGISMLKWVCSRVLELTYTAWDMEPFARDVGYDGPPFRWVPERRFLLRCELDAAFFHLYGLSRDDTDYVMDTFPIVRKNDEKTYGEYRNKRVILEIYDEMAAAAQTGKAYQTRLDPPPADPRVAHPPRQTDAGVTPRRVPKPAPIVAPEVEVASLPAKIPALPTDDSWQLLPQKVDTAAHFALAAVVLAAGEPMWLWRARLLAALSISKQQLSEQLSAADLKLWKKAVGRDPQAKWEPSVIDRAVDAACDMLCATSRLEKTADGKVVATAKLASEPPDATYMGRAAFVLERLGPVLETKAMGELRILFPTSMRDAPVIAVRA